MAEQISAVSPKIRANSVIDNFFEAPLDNPGDLSQLFSRYFTTNFFNYKSRIKYFASHPAHKNEIIDTKTAKLFSRVIPSKHIKYIYTEIKKDCSEYPEVIRAYIALRYCEERPLGTSSTLKKMKNVEITTESLCYKFACQAIKRHAPDFTNEFTEFRIQDETRIRKLAELSLRFDPKKFLPDLNEFDFFNEDIRDEFFLIGLIRSVDALQELDDDSFFKSALEKLPDIILKEIYEKFRFGEQFIKSAITSRVETEEYAHLDEKEVFAFAIQNADDQHRWRQKGFADLNLITEIAYEERAAFLGVIYLLKFFEINATGASEELYLTHHYTDLLEFLTEINKVASSGDRLTPITIAALVITKINSILPFPRNPEDKIACFLQLINPNQQIRLPKLHSLVSSIYKEFLSMAAGGDLSLLGKSKWKNGFFRRELIKFLTELCFSRHLNNNQKGEIVKIISKNASWQETETLSLISICLINHLGKELALGYQNPKQILEEQCISVLQRLSSLYSCPLPELSLLEHHLEIGCYARSIERLPYEAKCKMVPYFFEFLNLLAQRKVKSARFNTPKLKKLFKNYQLNLKIWRKETYSTIKEILSRNGKQAYLVDNEKYTNYSVNRSYDPYILFLIGSTPTKTCQSVFGDPEYNKCLLAYPMDGKNEVIFCTDQRGEIIARAIIRFFYIKDPSKEGTPRPLALTLYLEKAYMTHGLDKKCKDLLEYVISLEAIECAKALKVSLLTGLKPGEESKGYPYGLVTINGPAPFEYFDDVEGYKIKERDHEDEDPRMRFWRYISPKRIKPLFMP